SNISLGDLIDGGHGNNQVATSASQELANVTKIATTLYILFGDVLPIIRLNWAERLSEFDAHVNLRNMASLPRWSEIDFTHRREIQTLVDWLYQRINVGYPEAAAMIDDLVRVCILLASHAPVKEIIAGYVAQETNVQKGGRVDLRVDASRV